MLIEYLSDHGGEQLRSSQHAFADAEAQLAAWNDQYWHATGQMRAARRSKPLWKRLLSVSTPEEQLAKRQVWDSWQGIRHANNDVTRAYHRVQQQAAGVNGEDALEEGLSGLSDEWVMLRGYRNRGGETDHVLVGPDGVWAVEVKARGVRLHVADDDWWYEKYDSWGNLVGRQWAVDGGGRSWGRQVNAVARDLGAWLRKNRQRVWVRTAVMLMHHRATIGECNNLTVDLVGTHPQHLVDAMRNLASPLDTETRTEILRLIRRDHSYHNKRR